MIMTILNTHVFVRLFLENIKKKQTKNRLTFPFDLFFSHWFMTLWGSRELESGPQITVRLIKINISRSKFNSLYFRKNGNK